ncbi:hypothetical protein HZA97_07685 [Candidatus Woesearchaeota archaeon]|nr:hypothetical protein [Candidatus Woesearchaeota archaeon]
MVKNVTINLANRFKVESKENLSCVQLNLIYGELTVTGLPEQDELTHIARITREYGTIYYVIHEPKAGERSSADHKGLRLHVGQQNKLVEASILNVEVQRDGGTTILDFSFYEGAGTQQLYIPAKSRKSVPHVMLGGEKFELEMLLS